MPALPWFTNSTGFTAGMLVVLADAPLGGAIHTECPPGVGFTTAELSMTFLRPVRGDPDAKISGSGQVIHHGRSVALSEAFMINEASGELVAHGTSRCSIFPAIDPIPVPPAELPVTASRWPWGASSEMYLGGRPASLTGVDQLESGADTEEAGA